MDKGKIISDYLKLPFRLCTSDGIWNDVQLIQATGDATLQVLFVHQSGNCIAVNQGQENVHVSWMKDEENRNLWEDICSSWASG